LNQEPIGDYPLNAAWYASQNMPQSSHYAKGIWCYESMPTTTIWLGGCSLQSSSSGKGKYRNYIEFQDLSYTNIKVPTRALFTEKQFSRSRDIIDRCKYHLACWLYLFYEGRNLVGVWVEWQWSAISGSSWREVEKQLEQDQVVIDQYQQKRDAFNNVQIPVASITDVEQAKKESEYSKERKGNPPMQTDVNKETRRYRDRVSDSASRPEDVAVQLYPRKKTFARNRCQVYPDARL